MTYASAMMIALGIFIDWIGAWPQPALILPVIQSQLKLGETNIAAIVIDPKSRDEIPQLLQGPQYSYTITLHSPDCGWRHSFVHMADSGSPTNTKIVTEMGQISNKIVHIL